MNKLILASALLIFLSGKLKSQYIFDVRSLSMGNTSVANSYNTSAFNYNPANIIEQKSNDDASGYFSLLTNFGVYYNSDFASYGFYDKYFTKKNGPKKFLTDIDKQDILNSIGDGYTQAHASEKLLAIIANNSFGTLGFSIDERVGGNLTIDRDFLDLALNGNQINRNYDFSNLGFEASYIREINVAYANKIYFDKSKALDYVGFGIAVKPQLGMYYYASQENNLSVSTNDENVITGTGSMQILYAGIKEDFKLEAPLSPSGFGLGFDIGVNTKFKELFGIKNINAGFSLLDIGSVKWKKNTYEYTYDGNFVITDITDKGQLDSLEDVIESTKTRTGEFSTGLPTALRLGVQYKLFTGEQIPDTDSTGNLEFANFALEFIQGFTNDLGGTTQPMIAFGTEVNLTDIFSPRFGIALGGSQKLTLSAGLGIDLGAMNIDIGTHSFEGLFNPRNSSRLSGGLNIKFRVN